MSDGATVASHGSAGWGVAEGMLVGDGRRRGQRRQRRGGVDPRRHGRRPRRLRGAGRHRDEGRPAAHRGRRRLHDRVHDAEGVHRDLRRRGRGAGRLDVRGDRLRRRRDRLARQRRRRRDATRGRQADARARLRRVRSARARALPEGSWRAGSSGTSRSTSSRRGGPRCEPTNRGPRAIRRGSGPARSTRRRSSARSRRRPRSGATGSAASGRSAQRPLPSLDDLTFLPASLTRIPLEGYRERVRHDDRPRDPLRGAADHARHPGDDHRDELRRAVAQRQGRARARARAGSAARRRRATAGCCRPSARTRRR